MPYKFNFRQKSPQRRFLLILGFATFIACAVFGLMIMFWSKLIERINLPDTYRYALGSLFLIYAVLRFSRLFKEEPEDEK